MDGRIDNYPTHEYLGYRLCPGKPLPFGASLVPEGINFSVFSSASTRCTLVLFQKGADQPMVEIPFAPAFRIGHVYCMMVFDLDPETIEYGYRFDGPWQPEQGHRFNREHILLDPYAKAIGGCEIWREAPDPSDPWRHRGRLIPEDFDWEGDLPLENPIEDLIIYELHVRGFTTHPSSGCRFPGTFSGVREKILYLRELGVNCVELMPVFEFDEWENSRLHPQTGEQLLNYWGYSTLGFFAPKTGYAATGRYGMEVDELKTLIKTLHQNGIEVILDVVFNHTAEGNHQGPTISFRGMDNRTYYMLTPDGYYYNFSGCGNTLNCNHPVVRGLVLDCLRYWAAEYHVDGFRFDLASILGRDQNGAPMANPPLLEQLAHDPVLACCKLIAEAWDAGGLYQVGTFPAYNRWAEWNGKYRDASRRFLKGDMGLAGEMALRIQGSPDLYHLRGPGASINYLTCHDGFTLNDLYSYNHKHNEANGEDNSDGTSDNHSWNCGVEGDSDDPEVCALRLRMMKNALTLLFVSRGVPMLLMGDEMGRTQRGNNNAYCHDSELTWLDWDLLERNAELYRFTRMLIAFRKANPALRSSRRFARQDRPEGSGPEIVFHGVKPGDPDFSGTSRTLAFTLPGGKAQGGNSPVDGIYVAANMYWEALSFDPPDLPEPQRWRMFCNTGISSPGDIHPPGQEPLVEGMGGLIVGPRSIVVLVGRGTS